MILPKDFRARQATSFLRVAMSDWRVIREFLFNFRSGWAFRGQPRDWPLQTTLARALPPGLTTDERVSEEERLLVEFQRRVHHYTTENLKDHLDLRALLQHHGGPTRLLDFTRSPFVAAFFALDEAATKPEAERDRPVIWALNMQPINELAAQRIRTVDPDREGRRRLLQTGPVVFSPPEDAVSLLFDAVAVGHKESVLALGETDLLNRRMATQQGLFAVPMSLDADVEENLLATLGGPAPTDLGIFGQGEWPIVESTMVVKIVIEDPLGAKLHGMRDLHEAMNITHASLFPDLDGYARSFRTRAWLGV